MKTCTVIGCNQDTAEGDLYFCNSCRYKWEIEYLGEIRFRMILPADELLLLRKFQQESIKK